MLFVWEVSAVNQEEKRIKIAEACGWRYPNDATGRALSEIYPEQMIEPNATSTRTLTIPYYFNDLNAMAEAIQRHDQRLGIDGFWERLHAMRTPDALTGHWCDLRAVGMAEADELAEAFGLTLNLW